MERIEVRLTMDPSKRPDNMQELVKHEREVVLEQKGIKIHIKNNIEIITFLRG